jgi:hypothetical protein
MGWLRYFFLGDLGQQMDLQEQQDQIEAMRRQLAAQKPPRGRERGTAEGRKVEELERQVEKLWEENFTLRLYVATILRVLVTKKVVTREELEGLIHALDAEDGDTDQAFRGDVMPPER